MSRELSAAVAAFLAGVDALVAADVGGSSPSELLEALHDVETAHRRVPVMQHAALNRLKAEASPQDFGDTTLVKALAYRSRISTAEASRRFTRAANLGHRRSFTGEPLPPLLEHTAAAQALGLIGDEHVQVIQWFFKKLPAHVDFATGQQVERELAELATQYGPEELSGLAEYTLTVLHPDGDFSDAECKRKRGIAIGKQQADGTSYVQGWISAELRAMAEPLLAKFAGYGMCNPDDDVPTVPALDDSYDDGSGEASPGEDGSGDTEGQLAFEQPEPASEFGPEPPPDNPQPDSFDEPELEPARDPEPQPDPFDEPAPTYRDYRSQPQRNHDAVLTLCRTLLCSGKLGKLNGLPVTVIVSTTLQELERGAGVALTAGGSRLPMADLIRLSARAYHYLHVYDEHTGETLHLGRSRRCASPAQRIALIARERGCTRPGCTVDGYHSQVHHAVADWKDGGRTDVGDLTLACGPHNRLVDTTRWSTRKRDNGLTEWIPPPQLDTGQSRINHFHHPERLIGPGRVDDDVP
ncbi:DUF222 domain-containing protein [Mycolicibacterium sediminis]|uniref:HNH endonuclease n=1 Tax=Mycolicibacterium sediminis TaxID=1286180 RepID=A0A7I7QW07_9MYCO|nr:DUF222 domain-containing protein [Mycolicibacterium sediminis]BBY30462.1 HNH endonuclease [Mycolicibacterium sediminis]